MPQASLVTSRIFATIEVFTIICKQPMKPLSMQPSFAIRKLFADLTCE